MTLAQVYSLAYRQGFPHGEARWVLRAVADGTFGTSIERLTEQQLDRVAVSVRGMRWRPLPGYRRPAPPPIPLQARHVDSIRQLASRLAWSASLLAGFLKRFYGVDRPEGLTGADQADDCIGRLMAMLHQRRSARGGQR